jgi:hypothetical protein
MAKTKKRLDLVLASRVRDNFPEDISEYYDELVGNLKQMDDVSLQLLIDYTDEQNDTIDSLTATVERLSSKKMVIVPDKMKPTDIKSSNNSRSADFNYLPNLGMQLLDAWQYGNLPEVKRLSEILERIVTKMIRIGKNQVWTQMGK